MAVSIFRRRRAFGRGSRLAGQQLQHFALPLSSTLSGVHIEKFLLVVRMRQHTVLRHGARP